MARSRSLGLVIAATFLTINLGSALSQQTAPAASAAKSWEIPATDDGLPGVGPIRRHEGFRKLWRERRGRWAEQVDRDQGALVFLGDSITQNWGDQLGGSFRGMRVANRGISGDTTRGMLIRLEDVIALNPRGVVMLMGTNDVDNGATPEMIAGNVKLIISELEEHDSQLPIVLCEVFPSSPKKNRPKETIVELNKRLAAAVKDDRQVTLVDTWTLFADENGDAKPEEFPDLLHPNKAGYAKWAAALRPVLAQRGITNVETEGTAGKSGS
jgi:lysophospholipase L1-like esterase